MNFMNIFFLCVCEIGPWLNHNKICISGRLGFGSLGSSDTDQGLKLLATPVN